MSLGKKKTSFLEVKYKFIKSLKNVSRYKIFYRTKKIFE